MKQVLGKLSRGSILAYSLILLGIVLVASIGMMSASVTNLKSVSSSDKSINAFQIADSGSQAVVRMLKEAAGNELQDISGVTCDGSDAVVESPANFLGGKYKAIFLDSDGKTLACNDNISAVASVKSVGTYSDTARAVQVAVAAGCTPGTTRIVISSNSSAFNNSDNNGSTSSRQFITINRFEIYDAHSFFFPLRKHTSHVIFDFDFKVTFHCKAKCITIIIQWIPFKSISMIIIPNT